MRGGFLAASKESTMTQHNSRAVTAWTMTRSAGRRRSGLSFRRAARVVPLFIVVAGLLYLILPSSAYATVCNPDNVDFLCPDGATCNVSRACSSGICTSNNICTCSDSPNCLVGQSCGSDTDCSSGSCDPGTHTCQHVSDGSPCGVDGDCFSNVCTSNICACSNSPNCTTGDSCGANSDCGSGSCDLGSHTCQHAFDGSPCGVDGDCFSNVCTSNICACSNSPNCTTGDSCGANSDCGSGSCDTATTHTCQAVGDTSPCHSDTDCT